MKDPKGLYVDAHKACCVVAAMAYLELRTCIKVYSGDSGVVYHNWGIATCMIGCELPGTST